MTTHVDGAAAAVTERTCGICLEDSKNPLDLPCGHSFCDGCLDEWRSRYGVKEEMRRKCPICRASIPPSKEMVQAMLSYRATKQRLEDKNDTSSEDEIVYQSACSLLKGIEESIGEDWDGVTVLEDNRKPAVTMPGFIVEAIVKGNIKSVLKWINANRTEDRANATTGAEMMFAPALTMACMGKDLILMTLLLQLGANVDIRDSQGTTAIFAVCGRVMFGRLGSAEDTNKGVRLLLSWGANFFPDHECSREDCISTARIMGAHKVAELVKSELGGRRCEIFNLTSRPELNGETCVADEYLPDSNQYKVTLETKSKEVVVISPDNLKRRNRTPQDCGYYIEFKNGRTIRHDFDSSDDCQAFVAALNRGETQPVVTEEAEARAAQAAADLLAELGLDDSAIESSSSCKAKTSTKKKKGGKKKKKKK